jgi:ATP-dependent helicase/nuclease subunit A
VRAELEAFIAASEADLAPLLHEALQAAIADYELLKAKSGCLDFLDLLIKARDLVRDNGGVRRDLQNRFTHFFVDEFQDTDPLQAEILLLLASDDPSVTDWRAVRPVPGKLFLVGDRSCRKSRCFRSGYR